MPETQHVIIQVGLGLYVNRIGYVNSLLVVIAMSSLNLVYVMLFMPTEYKHQQVAKSGISNVDVAATPSDGGEATMTASPCGRNTIGGYTAIDVSRNSHEFVYFFHCIPRFPC